MGFDFGGFGDANLSEGFVEWLVDERWVDVGLHFGRLWDYYHNSMHDMRVAAGVDRAVSESSKGYVQSQECGLPARITGVAYSSSQLSSGQRVEDIQRKEVVIENDIGWRINAMVDFLFGKGVGFVSKSPDAGKRREIEEIVKAVFSSNGGIRFFQDMAVLGSVYGFVDCLVRPSEEVLVRVNPGELSEGGSLHSANSLHRSSFESILQASSRIGLELIEAPRVLPVLDENDYRKINYYVQNFYQQKNDVSGESGFLSRLFGGGAGGRRRQAGRVTEVIGEGLGQRY